MLSCASKKTVSLLVNEVQEIMVMMILWSTHQVLHRASRQTQWWGGPAGGQKPPAGRPRRADGSTSSLSAAVGGSGSESCRSPSRGEKLVQAALVPSRLYLSSTHTHTHINRIIYDCDRSKDSHRWIIGPVKKTRVWACAPRLRSGFAISAGWLTF